MNTPERAETTLGSELKHLATKADLKALELRMYGAMLVVGGLIVGVLRLTQ